MPAGIGNGICRYSVAVDNILIIRSSGQLSLGDRHSYRINSRRIEVVEVTLYAVVNTIRTGIFCLRQRRLPTILQGRIETVLEGTVVGLTGCDEGLVRCSINESVVSRRRGIGNRSLGNRYIDRIRDVVRVSLAHELIIYYVCGREGSLRQFGTPFAVIDTILDMTFLRHTGGDQGLCHAVIHERIICHRIGGDDRCINSLDAETFLKEVACFDIPANELVTVKLRSRIRNMEQCYFLILQFAILTDIRYVVLNLRYEIRPSLLGVSEFCYNFGIYQCFRSIAQCVEFLASGLDSSFDSRVINNLSRDCLDCCDSLQRCILGGSVVQFLYVSVIERTLSSVAQFVECVESCFDSCAARRVLNRSRDCINQVFYSLCRIQRSRTSCICRYETNTNTRVARSPCSCN